MECFYFGRSSPILQHNIWISAFRPNHSSLRHFIEHFRVFIKHLHCNCTSLKCQPWPLQMVRWQLIHTITGWRFPKYVNTWSFLSLKSWSNVYEKIVYFKMSALGLTLLELYFRGNRTMTQISLHQGSKRAFSTLII